MPSWPVCGYRSKFYIFFEITRRNARCVAGGLRHKHPILSKIMTLRKQDFYSMISELLSISGPRPFVLRSQVQASAPFILPRGTELAFPTKYPTKQPKNYFVSLSRLH